MTTLKERKRAIDEIRQEAVRKLTSAKMEIEDCRKMSNPRRIVGLTRFLNQQTERARGNIPENVIQDRLSLYRTGAQVKAAIAANG